MKEFSRFIKLMNSSQKKYTTIQLTEMWADWHCECDILKKSTEQLGITRHDRVKLKFAMGILGIEEEVDLTNNGGRMLPIFYKHETRQFYTTRQNEIIRKREYRQPRDDI